jgi:hypothetical protein
LAKKEDKRVGTGWREEAEQRTITTYLSCQAFLLSFLRLRFRFRFRLWLRFWLRW